MNYPNKICKPFIALPTVFSDQLSWYETLSKLYGYLQQQEVIIKEIQEQLGGTGGDSISERLEALTQTVESNTASIASLVEQLAQTNQNVQGLQQGIANLGQQLHTLTNRVSALEQNYGILESSSVIVNEVKVVPYN